MSDQVRRLVMKFAPVGIGAAMAVTVGRNGLGVLKNLGALVFTLYGTSSCLLWSCCCRSGFSSRFRCGASGKRSRNLFSLPLLLPHRKHLPVRSRI
jgi:hypothetical protein